MPWIQAVVVWIISNRLYVFVHNNLRIAVALLTELKLICAIICGRVLIVTVVTPRIANLVDVYGQSVNLEIKGRFPEQITPANIMWVRRGAGEWRR
jgi:hypothetical protein